MKCSVDGCNALHRIMVHHPGETEPRPYCAPHALMLARDVMRQQEELAPVIDIKTRKRIGSWSKRYATWRIDETQGFKLAIIDSSAPLGLGTGNSLTPQDKVEIKRMGRDLNSVPHNFTSSVANPRPSINAAPEEWARHLFTRGEHPEGATVTSQNESLALEQGNKYCAPKDENGRYLPDEQMSTSHLIQKTINQAQSLGKYQTGSYDENGNGQDTPKLYSTPWSRGYQGLHYLTNHTDTTNVPALARGIRFQNSDGSEATHDDVLKHFAVGKTLEMGHSAFSSDAEFAKSWAMAPVEVGYNEQGEKAVVKATKNRVPVVFHTPAQTQAVQISQLDTLNPTHRVQNEYLHSAGQFEVTDHQVDEDGVHHVYLKQTQVGLSRTPSSDQQSKIDQAIERHKRKSDPDAYEKANPGWKQKARNKHNLSLATKKMNFPHEWFDKWAPVMTPDDFNGKKSVTSSRIRDWAQRYAAEDTFGYNDPYYFDKLVDQANSGNPKLIQQKHVDFARAHGITEDEMMHAYTQGHSIASYVSARRRNDPWLGGPEAMKPRLVATHDEAIDALNKGVVPNHYSLLRTVGETTLNGRHNPTPTPLDHDEAVAKAGKITPQEKQRFMF